MGGAGECCDAICYKATSMSAPIPIKNSTMSPNPTQEMGGTHKSLQHTIEAVHVNVARRHALILPQLKT